LLAGGSGIAARQIFVTSGICSEPQTLRAMFKPKNAAGGIGMWLGRPKLRKPFTPEPNELAVGAVELLAAAAGVATDTTAILSAAAKVNDLYIIPSNDTITREVHAVVS
jgi:hypothetical protein